MEIRLERVTKRFWRTTALDEVSCTLPSGKIIALLGANGAGKTTFLSLLGGLLIPTQGTIYFDDEVFRRRRVDLRRRFYYLLDRPVYGSMETVLEHLRTRIDVYDVSREGLEDEIVDVLDTLSMLAHCDAGLRRLSRGQKYKAALAALFVVRPEVWLVDEPFASGIDPPAIAEFRRRARKHAESGGTVIYTTQIVDLAARLSDLVCVLDEGRLVAMDSMEGLDRVARHTSSVQEILVPLRDGEVP